MKINESILSYMGRLKALEGRTMKLHELHAKLREFRDVFKESLGWYYTDEDYDTDDEGVKVTPPGHCLDMIHCADTVGGLDRTGFHVNGQPLFEVFFVDHDCGGGFRDPENDITIDSVEVWCYPKGFDPEKAEAHFTVWCGGTEVNDFLLSMEDAEGLAGRYRKDGYDDVRVEDVLETSKIM